MATAKNGFPTAYPAEIRDRGIQMMLEGVSAGRVAEELGVSHYTPTNWLKAYYKRKGMEMPRKRGKRRKSSRSSRARSVRSTASRTHAASAPAARPSPAAPVAAGVSSRDQALLKAIKSALRDYIDGMV